MGQSGTQAGGEGGQTSPAPPPTSPYFCFSLLPGFSHAAFTFGYESFVHRSGAAAADVPPGALVSFVQKGLQYLELEANVNEVRRRD